MQETFSNYEPGGPEKTKTARDTAVRRTLRPGQLLFSPDHVATATKRKAAGLERARRPPPPPRP